MKLKDLIKDFSFKQIENRFFELFDQTEEVKRYFSPVWKEIERLVPLSEDSDMMVFIQRDEWGYDVFGKNGTINEHTKNLENFALEFIPWQEWLGMEISKEALREYGPLDVICICIDEMLTVGLDQNTIMEVKKDIDERYEKAISGMAKMIPFEELFDKIKENHLDWEKDSYGADPLKDVSFDDI